MKFVIHSKSKRGFWSNILGWVRLLKDATVFHTTDYKLPVTLAKDAEWLPIEYED